MQATDTKTKQEQNSYMLSNKTFNSIFEKSEDLNEKKKPVVLSLDYDNCAHILFPYIRRVIKVCSQKNMEFVYQLLFPLLLLLKYLDNQYKEINVVCGSARQTHATDRWNRNKQISSYTSYYEKFPDLIIQFDFHLR